MVKPRLIALTGAGISAESGLRTFRDSDGLWEGHNVEDVATPEAWQRHPVLVQNFYNMRRKDILNAKPNPAHYALKKLEHKFNVTIITQNIDDLHERAGSTDIIHLHGIITKSQSSLRSDLVYNIEGPELKMGEKCELGSQLRPNVVWFGEAVPMIEPASAISAGADIFLIIGTSLAVYPAAGLIDFVPKNAVKIIIDPKASSLRSNRDIRIINEKASIGVPMLVDELLS